MTSLIDVLIIKREQMRKCIHRIVMYLMILIDSKDQLMQNHVLDPLNLHMATNREAFICLLHKSEA